ncbi:cytochrome P450 [Exidia glandulosa HHB12029]|uniref:Cytochrome P450 n=1 Tax=Exidia glandulosa HHB12029 TaxID=1314781 RepID=A0A165EJA5_EXIGL|nr:cytochrome P450 [Exidia glandulosa HHB12029]
MSFSPTTTLSVTATALAAIALLVLNSRHGRKQLPPGPTPYPFIGNFPQMSIGWAGQPYAEMVKTWGPIIYFRVPGREFIFLNRLEDAVNLFEKRGNLYSNRPHMHMAHELVGRKITVLFSQYGERLKNYRRMINTVTNSRAAPQQWDTQTRETHKLLGRLLVSPDDFLHHLSRHAVSVTMRMVYGHIVPDGEETYIDLAEKMAKLTNIASQPGRWLVDSFRWMEHLPDWIPGAQFKRTAKQLHYELEEFTNRPMRMTKENMRNGRAEACFAVSQLEDKDASADELHEEYVKYAAAGMYSGGTDSAISFLSRVALYMTVFPEAQQKAQTELDRVIGAERLPAVEDMARLPYVDAVIKEIHRFSPIINLVPHSSPVDDEYKGYIIPAGSAVIANSWAFAHDESMYPESHKFDPDRYLGTRGEGVVDPRQFVFGLGRRRCPGVAVAESFTFLAVASLLSVFNFKKAVDAEGREITPAFDFDDALVSQPGPFKCEIVPRSEAAAALIQRAVQAAEV